jgi:heme-degrading monooxygenase HmoA
MPSMITSTLRRKTTVTQADDWAKRQPALEAKLLPYLQRQPGFVSHEMRREDDAGQMTQVTVWQSMEDCRNYLRNGGAAMAATWLDAFFPTAPYPDGNWVRENAES